MSHEGSLDSEDGAGYECIPLDRSSELQWKSRMVSDLMHWLIPGQPLATLHQLHRGDVRPHILLTLEGCRHACVRVCVLNEVVRPTSPPIECCRRTQNVEPNG